MVVRRRGWPRRVTSSKTDGRKEGMTGSDGVRRSGASETAAGRSGKRERRRRISDGDGDGDSEWVACAGKGMVRVDDWLRGVKKWHEIKEGRGNGRQVFIYCE